MFELTAAIGPARQGRLRALQGAASSRSVPVSRESCGRREKAAENATDAGLVFTGRDGSHLDATGVARWFRVAAEKADVPWATPHCCRHTCASWLLQRGVSIKQVQVWLGHANAAITPGVYSHLVPEDLPASPFGDDLGTIAAEADRDDEAGNRPDAVALRAISS